MRILIKNGYLLNPADGTEGLHDILIEDGIIIEIKPKIDEEGNISRVIDAEGKYVMPGFIDMHVHLREPGYEYKETIRTGTMAAAAGGYTTICPMPNTDPAIDSKEMVEYILKKAAEESLVNILPVGAVTKGQKGTVLSDIKGMKEAGAAALSEDGKSVMDSLLYKKAMQMAAEEGLLIFAHCEDKDLVNGGVMNAGKKAEELNMPGISNSVEDVITARDIILAKDTGVRLHLCHCSTKDSPALVKLGKELGVQVSAEVCPHHFSMTEEDILDDDADYKMNPPLRSTADVDALKKALKDNVIEVISTDHAPHSEEEKKKSMREAPFGITGLETAFALTMTHLVKTGVLTPMQMVEKMSCNPARILGIPKGNIAAGFAADIVIADPDEVYVVDPEQFYSKGKNTPFKGHKVTGRIILTMAGGRIIYEKGKIVNE